MKLINISILIIILFFILSCDLDKNNKPVNHVVDDKELRYES